MRLIGTNALGIRIPIISSGDNLAEIVADCVYETHKSENMELSASDVVGITEAVVAKAQGNYANISHIGEDVRRKFNGGEVGVVFPILSRNRFLNILKGIAMGASKVYVLLNYPNDEVGNPIMDDDMMDEISQYSGPIKGKEFLKLTAGYVHPFTGIDYISLYESAGDNIEVYVSKDSRDILSLTKNVIVSEIHKRTKTKNRLIKAGAENIYTLTDILSEPITFNGETSGCNPDYGVLGSNMATEEKLKLFPRNCDKFVEDVRRLLFEKTGVSPEVLVYGDGAFKDPAFGIWELADPVVSPAHTEKLKGQPRELKLKFIADNQFADLDKESQKQAVTDMIRQKNKEAEYFREGTTPRKYADLLGSLCDLMSGSGDKGTPVILIKGYFDDYATE